MAGAALGDWLPLSLTMIIVPHLVCACQCARVSVSYQLMGQRDIYFMRARETWLPTKFTAIFFSLKEEDNYDESS